MAEEQGHADGRYPGAPNAGPTSQAVRGRLVSRRLLWWPRDPGFAALRRALRAAIVIPLAMAFALLVFHHAQATINVVFGCFALLVLADFGGLRRPRAAAYVGTTLVGLVLVTLGTLASANPWVGASAMLLVGFVVSFAGVFGGYIAAAESALLLHLCAVGLGPCPAHGDPRSCPGMGHRRRRVDPGECAAVAAVRALHVAQPGCRRVPRARRPPPRDLDRTRSP